MLSIEIHQVGKTKDADIQRLISDFYRRVKGSAVVNETTYKSEEQMMKSLSSISSGFFITLEVKGKEIDSEQFAQLIEDKKNQGHSTLVFIIGPPDGFTQTPERVDYELSLSKMTFSHQTIRLILAEQIYRAISILDGKPFAKH